MEDLPEHVARNRSAWDTEAARYVEDGQQKWADDQPRWGIWSVPEADVGMLAGIELDGLDTIELGCGTAYVSAWLARRGARPVGIDNSEAQLATARELQQEHGLEFPLIHGNAEATGLPDASFDVAISEYGASIWCDPYTWIPEASRLLRPGGRLVFLLNSVLAMLCMPDAADEPVGDRLQRPLFGMHRMEWPDEEFVEFHLSHGDQLRWLRREGFEVEDLVEVRPREDAVTRYDWMPLEWARRWPCEEVWKARKRG
jgi:SAM-dependent methyltransferase